MSTSWPTHKDIKLNRHLINTYKKVHKRYDTIRYDTIRYDTIRYYKRWKLFHIGCQVGGGEISAISDALQSPTAQEIASKLSGFIDHKKNVSKNV